MAGAIAQDTSGVKELRNDLVIDPATRPNPETSRLSERVADLEIKTIVEDAIRKSPELKDRPIELVVRERKVSLNGVVDTESQKSLAQQIASGSSRRSRGDQQYQCHSPASGRQPGG